MNFEIMYLDELLDRLANGYCTNFKQKSCEQQPQETVKTQPKVSGFWCPKISRVTFNGDTTIVWFTDGTYCIVNCSADDKYDRKTAIAYAIVKRLLGKVGKYDKKAKKFKPNEIDGAGFSTYLQKTADAGFDQQLEEKLASEKKACAKAQHQARQEAQHKAAFDRRVEERAKQIILERAAIDRANELEDLAKKISSCGKNCTCHADNDTAKSKTEDILKTYKRPNKLFADFTPAEKREYWKFHNAKKRANK